MYDENAIARNPHRLTLRAARIIDALPKYALKAPNNAKQMIEQIATRKIRSASESNTKLSGNTAPMINDKAEDKAALIGLTLLP